MIIDYGPKFESPGSQKGYQDAAAQRTLPSTLGGRRRADVPWRRCVAWTRA
jgi:hypothetical protein